jgi:hypothetical protein
MAEVAIPRNLFADILRPIAELRLPPAASTAEIGVRDEFEPFNRRGTGTTKSYLIARPRPLSWVRCQLRSQPTQLA